MVPPLSPTWLALGVLKKAAGVLVVLCALAFVTSGVHVLVVPWVHSYGLGIFGHHVHGPQPYLPPDGRCIRCLATGVL